MNVHVSYKVQKSPDLEREINHQIDKLRKRLQVFRPELVHLKAVVEQGTPREGIHVALNLRLPSGQLSAGESAASPTAAVKSVFDELMEQIVRHKDMLRASHKWRSLRGGERGAPTVGVPFEETMAAVMPPTISADDVRGYVDANLSRLQRFIDREIYFRHVESSGEADGLSTDEVVDEVIALALTDGDRPEKLSLEPWLYRLAMQVMDDMDLRHSESDSEVHLEDSRRRPNVEASDEPGLQFHQPDEIWTRESAIADQRMTSPEQAAYADEIVALVQSALRGADRTDREAFLLYGIEGFSLAEIAAITGRHPEAVRESIERAREQVRHAPSVANEFHRKLIQTTGA